MRRQDLEKLYMPNGAIYVSTPENLRKYKSFYCFRSIPYIMPPERSVDIDNEIDFMLAELLMRSMEFNKVQEIVMVKVEKNIMILKDFPHITEKGKWITTEDGNWTGGFWVGLFWHSYKISGDEKYKKLAYNWLKKLEKRKNDRTFDLGFLFYPSLVLGYKITKDIGLRATALEAAGTLATLFNEKAGFIYHEIIMNDKRVGRTIIDVMMNLPLERLNT